MHLSLIDVMVIDDDVIVVDEEEMEETESEKRDREKTDCTGIFVCRSVICLCLYRLS